MNCDNQLRAAGSRVGASRWPGGRTADVSPHPPTDCGGPSDEAPRGERRPRRPPALVLGHLYWSGARVGTPARGLRSRGQNLQHCDHDRRHLLAQRTPLVLSVRGPDCGGAPGFPALYGAPWPGEPARTVLAPWRSRIALTRSGRTHCGNRP